MISRLGPSTVPHQPPSKKLAVATEAIGSFRTVYSFAQEGSEHQRYAGAIDVYYDLNVKQSLMQAGYYMVCSTFLYAPTMLLRDVFCVSW